MTELVIYQTLHIAGGRPRNLAEHIAVLHAASTELFGRPYTPAPSELAARIAALTAAERYPQGLSGFVRIELTAAGAERLLPLGPSLYEGYALRSVTPDAVTIRCAEPFPTAPTTLREATLLTARQQALRRGAGVAVCRDAADRLLAADDAPLFGVAGKQLFPGAEWPGAERALVLRTARAAGLQCSDEPLTAGLLPRLDELFYADHRGVTALAHCDGYPFTTFAAERIAAAMEAAFQKK